MGEPSAPVPPARFIPCPIQATSSLNPVVHLVDLDVSDQQTCSATTYYTSWWSMWYLWVVIIIILSCCGGCIGHYRRQKMLKRAGVQRGQVFVVQAQHGQSMQNQYMSTPPPPGAYPQQQYPPGNFNQGFMPMPEPTMKPPSYDEVVSNPVPPPSAAPQGNTTATVDMPAAPPPYQS